MPEKIATSTIYIEQITKNKGCVTGFNVSFKLVTWLKKGKAIYANNIASGTAMAYTIKTSLKKPVARLPKEAPAIFRIM